MNLYRVLSAAALACLIGGMAGFWPDRRIVAATLLVICLLLAIAVNIHTYTSHAGPVEGAQGVGPWTASTESPVQEGPTGGAHGFERRSGPFSEIDS